MKVSRFAKSIVLLNCAVPLILLAWDAVAGRLGANPVNFAIRTTGVLSLIFIILTLAITPASRFRTLNLPVRCSIHAAEPPTMWAAIRVKRTRRDPVRDDFNRK